VISTTNKKPLITQSNVRIANFTKL